MATVPLRRLVDDHQWEAEDLAGRLGIVAHAAFLRAGFVPYGDEPSSGVLLKQVDEIGPSAPRLSRRYTAAQLVRREGADAAVLEVRAQGSGNVAFQAYLLTMEGDRRCVCDAVLDEVTLAPLLACRVADAARALETQEPVDASLWKSLADWVFPVLFLELCRRNDLPVTGFASLPEDIKAETLKRLTDGKDLARVECVSKQLRRVVAERDSQLWKAMYESLGLVPEVQSSDSESEGMGSWKQRYVKARRRRPRRRFLPWLCGSYDGHEDWLAQRRRRQREADMQRLLSFEFRFRVRVTPLITDIEYSPYTVRAHPPAPPVPEPEVVVTRGKNAGRQHRKVPRKNDYQKKRHGAGATHSPSSRYKWKHR